MADLTSLDCTTLVQDALPAQFASGTNFLAFMAALAQGGAQNLDDVQLLVQASRDLDDAIGVQLDQIGQLLDQPRYGGAYPLGEVDSEYRIKLRAAVLRNRSMGTIEDLRTMVRALLVSYTPQVQIVEVAPAAFKLMVYLASPITAATEQTLIAFVLAAKPAGVLLAAVGWGVAPIFAFDGFPDPPFKGYDDGTGLVGGYWLKYIYP